MPDHEPSKIDPASPWPKTALTIGCRINLCIGRRINLRIGRRINLRIGRRINLRIAHRTASVSRRRRGSTVYASA